jgi:hypothetical protein
MRKIELLIESFLENKFWGEIVIKVKNGVPVLIEKRQIHKLD